MKININKIIIEKYSTEVWKSMWVRKVIVPCIVDFLRPYSNASEINSLKYIPIYPLEFRESQNFMLINELKGNGILKKFFRNIFSKCLLIKSAKQLRLNKSIPNPPGLRVGACAATNFNITKYEK